MKEALKKMKMKDELNDISCCCSSSSSWLKLWNVKITARHLL